MNKGTLILGVRLFTAEFTFACVKVNVPPKSRCKLGSVKCPYNIRVNDNGGLQEEYHIPNAPEYMSANERSVNAYPMSELAKATLPRSGLRRNSGSGFIPLVTEKVLQLYNFRISKQPDAPDERVNFFNCSFYFIICISRWNSKLKYQTVDLVNDEGNCNILG